MTLMAACLLLFVYESRLITEQVDDAYITYQYSKNLAEGNGYVFNVGERVEGITNPLWAVSLAVGIYLGCQVESFSHYLGVLTGIGLLLASYWYALTLLPRQYRFLACFVPLIVYASNPFINWVLSGLETGLFTACIIAALAAQNSKRTELCMFFGVLALLARPDGVLLAAALVLTQYIEQLRSTRQRLPSREILVHGGVYFITLLVLTLFRVVYFNDVVPNTFYAKVGGLPLSYGFRYIWYFLRDGAIFLVIPFAVAAIYCRALLNGVIFSVLLLLYVVFVGGDVFSNSRFLLPLIPILSAGSLFSISYLLGRHQRTSAALVILAVAMMPLWSLNGPTWSVFGANWVNQGGWSAKRMAAYPKSFSPDESVKAKIAKIRQMDPPVQLIASIGIGRLRYWSEIPVLDMLGLTNKIIAKHPQDVDGVVLAGHFRSNADYVLSRRPDVILIQRKGSVFYPILPVHNGLWSHPGLDADYRWDNEIGGYVRKSYPQPAI